jgi:hypothetical protein
MCQPTSRSWVFRREDRNDNCIHWQPPISVLSGLGYQNYSSLSNLWSVAKDEASLRNICEMKNCITLPAM